MDQRIGKWGKLDAPSRRFADGGNKRSYHKREYKNTLHFRTVATSVQVRTNGVLILPPFYSDSAKAIVNKNK